MKTFPDDENILANEALGKTLLADIEVAKKQLDNETILGKFAESLKKFIKDTKVPQITAEVLITPSK
jgi:chromosome condensin MukBEF MukE localization factor